jgi:hypothetical protein
MGIERMLVQIPDHPCHLVATLGLLIGNHQLQAGARRKEMLIPATGNKRITALIAARVVSMPVIAFSLTNRASVGRPSRLLEARAVRTQHTRRVKL